MFPGTSMHYGTVDREHNFVTPKIYSFVVKLTRSSSQGDHIRSKSSMLCNSMKILLARKATGNHLMKSASLEKSSEPCLWFLLRSRLSTQRTHRTNHYSSLEHKIFGTTCLLLAFLHLTTCHLSNLRSINLI